MKAVGVGQLEARLSEYVRLVRAGETILVTDRDEAVAALRPVRSVRSTPCTPPPSSSPAVASRCSSS